MPAKSKAQFRKMKGLCEGTIKRRKGDPPREVACEIIKGQSPKGLPERKRKKK